MVAKVIPMNSNTSSNRTLQGIMDAQRSAFRKNPWPTLAQRQKTLTKLKSRLLDQREQLASAITHDFESRSPHETLLADIYLSVQTINYTLSHLGYWMKPEKRRVDPLFMPARNQVHYQPKGVVGIIAPWNYPVSLAVGPLIAALAAGNRVMVKMSEHTPATAAAFREMIQEEFPEDLIAVVEGDANVATEFTRLPFDHLMFTGSTSVGKLVMREAAENLTPVTLELGGKSPAIISADVPMADAVERICFGKSFNAGQTCIAPDYVLCPHHRVEAFVDTYKAVFKRMFPSIKNNPDYTSIINHRQYNRLMSWLDNARHKGARIIPINPAGEDFSRGSRKIPIHLVLNTTDDMLISREEIFGPILPVIPYTSLQEAITFINDRPRPLALYYFGYNKTEQHIILQKTHAGGVSINEVLMHFMQEDMPFGGTGGSGMGHYHGREGFLTFSHAKSVHGKQRINSLKMIYPPYSDFIHNLLMKLRLR